MAINNKRGRPATGRAMDGVLFLRLPNSKKEEVRSLVKGFLERPDSPSDARPAINQPPDKHANEVMQLLSDINSREAEKMDLLDRISSLEAGITDEVVVRLKAENRQLKELVMKYEQERF